MTTTYPAANDSPTNPVGSNTLSSPDHAAEHSNANDALVAIEARLGNYPAALTTTLVETEKVTGDTNDRHQVTADGTHKWGPGNAATDVTFARTGTAAGTLTGALTVSGALTANSTIAATGAVTAPSVALTGATAGTVVESEKVTGDANNRFAQTADGGMAWGPGNAVADVTLARSGTAAATLTGALTVTGAVTANSTIAATGAITQGGAAVLLAGQTLKSIQIATVGSGTYTKPAGITNILVECIGGGGGGGGAATSTASNSSVGGGGGGGSYAMKYVPNAAASYSYTVGAGGAGGSGGTGTAGGTTSFGSNLCTAGGGSPGGTIANSNTIAVGGPASGGSATFGDLKFDGEQSGQVMRLAATVCVGGNGGTGCRGASGGAGLSGTSNGGGGGGSSPGGGGGGAMSTGGSGPFTGGAGGAGIVIVYELA